MTARAALLAWALPALLAPAAAAQDVTAARYADPTDRYAHGVLGDDIEHGALVMETAGGPVRLTLPRRRVFEDTAPRLSDIDGDGAREVVVVESDAGLGARLAIYNPNGLVAATDFIGRPFRWLAPVGAGDLDGDGAVEVAFVDRPHLARVLRVVRLDNGRLEEVASASGLTNHRIGERDISGGLRDCGGGLEMILADVGWASVMAARLTGGGLEVRRLGPLDRADALDRALACGTVD